MTGLDAGIVSLVPVQAWSETNESRSSEEASLLASTQLDGGPKKHDGQNTDIAPKRARRDWIQQSLAAVDIETGGHGWTEKPESVGHSHV